MLKEKELNELSEKVIKEVKMMENALQFIKDSGEYKKRKLYNISDHEFNEKVNQFINGIVLMQFNFTVADFVLAKYKKFTKDYHEAIDQVGKKVKEKLLNQKKSNKKPSFTGIINPEKKIIH